jgi:hypothetical protein
LHEDASVVLLVCRLVLILKDPAAVVLGAETRV